MEILKKSMLLILLLGFQLLTAQDRKSTQEAFSKSYSLESEKKYNEAIDALRKLNATNNYPVQLRLGFLLNSAKKYDESIAAYKKAAQIMPASIEPLLALVYPLASLKKWNELEQNNLKIIKIDPKNSVTNFRLGQIYYNKKEYTKAEKYFSVTLNLYPFDYDTMLMSGWNCYFLGKYNEAKELFYRVLLYSPSDSSAKEGLSLIK